MGRRFYDPPIMVDYREFSRGAAFSFSTLRAGYLSVPPLQGTLTRLTTRRGPYPTVKIETPPPALPKEKNRKDRI